MTTTFCVVFRTGGTINYQWHRTVAFTTLAEAELVAEETRRMGYVAHVENYSMSLSVGLPETYDLSGGPIDPEDWVEAEEREAVLRSMGRVMDETETLREFHEDYDRWGNE
jgi:hypothetical protein